MKIMNSFNDDSSTNDEIQRMWDKLEGIESNDALDEDTRICQRLNQDFITSSSMTSPSTNAYDLTPTCNLMDEKDDVKRNETEAGLEKKAPSFEIQSHEINPVQNKERHDQDIIVIDSNSSSESSDNDDSSSTSNSSSSNESESSSDDSIVEETSTALPTIIETKSNAPNPQHYKKIVPRSMQSIQAKNPYQRNREIATLKDQDENDGFPFFEDESIDKDSFSPYFSPTKENEKAKSPLKAPPKKVLNQQIMIDSGSSHATDISRKVNIAAVPSLDVVPILDCQPESGPKAEIHWSFYDPQPFKEKLPPRLQHFTSHNRPIQSRQKIAVSSLFPAPVNRLWRSKFETFNHLQSEVSNTLCHSDDNIVVSAPTGAGKTAIFEMGLARFILRDLQIQGVQQRRPLLSKNRKIVYIAPSKALCEERYEDWSRRLSSLQLGIQLSMITGDAEPGYCFGDLTSSQFILTTPEKWDSLTRRWTENFFLLASVKLLMIDEVHLLGDPSRGSCLEAIITRMKTIQQASQKVDVSPRDLQMSSYQNTTPEAVTSCMRVIAVSATLPNIQAVADFLGANEAYSFDDSYRPVPLTIQVAPLGYIGKNEFQFWTNLDQQIPHLIARYSDGKQTLIFCHTKKETQKLTNLLIQNNFGHPNFRGSSFPSGTVQYCIESGVGYHHAGMPVSERKRIEQAFAERKLRCLCATSTLAVGVNLPAHLVIVKGTRSWRTGGYQEIDSRSILQMVGRAGRPGLDSSGMAIIMTDNQSKSKYEMLAKGLGAAESQMLSTLIDVINTEVSQQVIKSVDGALRWLKTTFLYTCLREDPLAFGVDLRSQTLDSFLLEQCQNAIQKLIEVGLIESRGDEAISPLPACHIMSQTMVPFEAMTLISTLPFDATLCQILKTISEMETLHFPVRRLEKSDLNACHKSEIIRFKLEGPLSKVRIQKPNQKAFVLLQAYIARENFENFTLRQEMSTLADKAQRILSAAQDYSVKGSKHGQVALQCLKLRRSLDVCLWGEKSGILNQIKDVGHKCTNQLKFNGIVNFDHVLSSTEDQIEKAAGRPKPFGKRLQDAVSKIFQGQLSLSAEIEYTRGSNLPAGIKCHVHSSNRAKPTIEMVAQVKYALVSSINPSCSAQVKRVSHSLMKLVYTDRPGSLLFFQEGITKAGSYRFSCPLEFGKVYLHLIASIVGLDQTCVLDGNEAVHSSSFEKPKASQIKKKAIPFTSKKVQKKVPIKRTSNSQTPRNNNFRHIDKAKNAPKRHQVDVQTPLQGQPSREKTLPEAFSPQIDIRAPRFPNPRMLSGALISPHQQSVSDGFRTLPKMLPRQSLQQKSNSQGVGSEHKESSNFLAKSEVVNVTPVGGIAKKRELTNSWSHAKRKQQRFQQRAFTRKNDNPFAFFQHDPNDGESFLESLSMSKSPDRSSLIPKERLKPYRSKSHQMGMYKGGMVRNRNRRPFRSSYNVSSEALLRMKAAESQAVPRAPIWRCHGAEVPRMEQYPSSTNADYQHYPEQIYGQTFSDRFRSPLTQKQPLPNNAFPTTPTHMYSRLPPAPITQPHPDSYHDHTSLMQNFQGERVMNYHPSTTLMPEAFYGTHVSCEPSALQRSSEVEYWEYANRNFRQTPEVPMMESNYWNKRAGQEGQGEVYFKDAFF